MKSTHPCQHAGCSSGLNLASSCRAAMAAKNPRSCVLGPRLPPIISAGSVQ